MPDADARTQVIGRTPWRIAATAVVALRPHQWIKNLFVLTPLVFAQRVFAEGWHLDWNAIGRALLATAAFCLASGAIYVLNDLVDRERDRQHPVKRLRPIASGALPVPVAVLTALVAASGALGGAAVLGGRALAIVAAFFALNGAYSFWLKHIVLVDVISIAAGFLLRVAAGGAAIAVPVTGWLYTCTFLLACTLALGKRKHEVLSAGPRAVAQRGVLAAYAVRWLDPALVVAATATAVTYTAYSVSDHAARQFGTRALVWTVPFIVFGLVRFLRLVRRADTSESPTEAMVRDRLFVANLVLWALAVGLTVYLVR